jgi:putative methyltransferase (TIGR04325 family)
VNQVRALRTPVFSTYEKAIRASGNGYSDDELAAVVLAKTKRAGSPSVSPTVESATLLALALAGADRGYTRVLDFGGAFGTAHYLTKDRFPANRRWAVVENPAFVKAGRELETEQLRFFSSIGEAAAWLGSVDLCYSSGAIQYTPDPEEVVRQLRGTNPKVVAFLRCAISEGERIVTVQSSPLSRNGPGALPSGTRDRTVRYPRTFSTRGSVVGAFGDYRLIAHQRDGLEQFTIGGQQLVSGESFIWCAPYE